MVRSARRARLEPRTAASFATSQLWIKIHQPAGDAGALVLYQDHVAVYVGRDQHQRGDGSNRALIADLASAAPEMNPKPRQ
jgi:hypothetical protein